MLLIMETELVTIPLDVFKQAASVTCSFLVLMVACLTAQAAARIKHAVIALRQGQQYERPRDLALIPYDRTVGNLIEWALPFLGFFWISIILTHGATANVAWFYVACRALYPFVAVGLGGVAYEGPRPIIITVTWPAYGALIMMAVSAIKALLV